MGTSSIEETASVLAESMSSHAHERERRWGSVWVVREETSSWPATSSLSPAAAQIGPVPVDSRLPLAEAIRRRRPIYVTDVAEGMLEYPSIGEYAYIAKSFAVLPILLGDACSGVLVIASKRLTNSTTANVPFLLPSSIKPPRHWIGSSLYAQLSDLADMSSFFREGSEGVGRSLELRRHPRAAGNPRPGRARGYCLIDVIDERGELQRMVARHRDPSLQHLVDPLRTRYPPRRNSPHPAAEVSRVGTASWSAQMTDAYLRSTTIDQRHFEITKALGFKSYLAVPLKSGDELLGSVTFVSSGRPFSSRHVAFAEGLAQQVAAVVDNTRRSEAALMTSRFSKRACSPTTCPTSRDCGSTLATSPPPGDSRSEATSTT